MMTMKEDDFLVRVKAQVMTRDDSTSCWVPMGGGGMSIVGLRKLVVQHGEDIRHEYLIHGHKITDQSVVLNCVLKKDVQYMKANPTFHHWRVEEKRFGLTFQSSADARAFDKAVKRAVEDLLEGSPDSSNDIEVGDDEVFMAVDLPIGRKDSSSQSASTASTTTSSPTPQSPAFPGSMDPFSQFTPLPSVNNAHLHRVHYITRPMRPSPPQPGTKSRSTGSSDSNGHDSDIWIRAEKKSSQQRMKLDSTPMDDNIALADNYSYVQFKSRPSVHEYSYPTIDAINPNKPPERRESLSSLKKGTVDIGSQPKLPTKSKKKRRVPVGGDRTKGRGGDKKHSALLLSQRSRCVYCHEMFLHDDNHRGICEDAPDKMVKVIEHVSCICCAHAMLYHCMSDWDGDYGHPCVCDAAEDNHCRKWTALTILSLFVPCLWCYPPLTACHRWGKSCGCCGGRHKAA